MEGWVNEYKNMTLMYKILMTRFTFSVEILS